MPTSPVANANPATLAAPADFTRWSYVGLLLACGIGASMQVGKVPPALGFVQRDLHLGLVAGAWVISMFSIVGATLGCLAGSVVDRMGPRRAATGGLFCIAMASLGGSFASLPWVLLLSRALEGMAFVMVVVAIPGLLVASASESDRRFVPALWGIYMPTGTAISLATAQPVLHAYGWRVLWQVDAAVLLLLGVGLLLARAPDVRMRGRALLPWRELIRSVWHPGPLLLGVIFACYTVQYLSVMGFLPTILQTQGMSAQAAGLLSALAVVANAAGNLSVGALLARGARPRLLIAGACVVMMGAAAGIYLPQLPAMLRYLLMVILLGVGGLIPASIFALVPRVTQDRHSSATTMGLVVQCSHVGQLAGPPAVAAVAAAAGGFQWSALVLIPAALGAFAAARGLRRVL
ncbi:MAG TPA: MFS transporter [Steroidobacteraceae bacterium]|nr:MFS transporter [Steroidobacteraceae bacterium]